MNPPKPPHPPSVVPLPPNTRPQATPQLLLSLQIGLFQNVEDMVPNTMPSSVSDSPHAELGFRASPPSSRSALCPCRCRTYWLGWL